MFDSLHRHLLNNPAINHLRGLLTDIISEMENMQNDSERRVSQLVGELVPQLVQQGLKDMSDLVNQLTAAVADLTAKVAAHDAIVQAVVSDIKDLVSGSAMSPGDQGAISDALAKLATASTTIAGESANLGAAIAPPAASPAAPTA